MMTNIYFMTAAALLSIVLLGCSDSSSPSNNSRPLGLGTSNAFQNSFSRQCPAFEQVPAQYQRASLGQAIGTHFPRGRYRLTSVDEQIRMRSYGNSHGAMRVQTSVPSFELDHEGDAQANQRIRCLEFTGRGQGVMEVGSEVPLEIDRQSGAIEEVFVTYTQASSDEFGPQQHEQSGARGGVPNDLGVEAPYSTRAATEADILTYVQTVKQSAMAMGARLDVGYYLSRNRQNLIIRMRKTQAQRTQAMIELESRYRYELITGSSEFEVHEAGSRNRQIGY